jgi:predicted AAA+ superfamily ATPase
MKLSAYYGEKLYERESLIIFDEVQLYPRARSGIKYLVADGRYDFIETGSLISIKKNVKDILIPSEEDSINMYPMDFEEFLWAVGNESMFDLIRDCYNRKRALGQALHRKAMDYFRQYMIVGGMPQAVKAYIDTNDFDEVDKAKRRILKLYRDDIRKHAEGYEKKVEAIYDELPYQLKNQNRHFKLSSLKQGARFDEYKEAMFWLSDAMIVNNCYNSTEPNVGLSLNMDRTLLKCYMGDTGLLISHAFDENGIVSEEVYKKLLLDKLEVNMGMVTENIVAQMLI